MKVKSFRGMVKHQGIETINLHTNDGAMGYKIVKFAVVPHEPTSATVEAIVQIFKTSQSAASDKIDFSNQTLIGSAFYNQDSAAANHISDVIIFDTEIFNQDIHVTNVEGLGSSPMNYYIELEQVKLDLNESTVATLRDIRNTTSE